MTKKRMGALLVCSLLLALLPAAGLAVEPPPVEYIEVEVPREVFSTNRGVQLAGGGDVTAYLVEETSPGEYVAGAAQSFPAGTAGELIEHQCTEEYAAIAIGGRLYYVPWNHVSLMGYIVHAYIDGVIIMRVPAPQQPQQPNPQQPE